MIASSAIDASLTTKSLSFRPDGPPVSFGVSVINRSSQFASFQLEVLAAGASPNHPWYTLSPEVSTAKSPGDRTHFKVEIRDAPLPDFVGTVNLVVRIFSPQLAEEQRLILHLGLEARQDSTPLQMGLPIQRFQVYPHNRVDIPVKLRNTSTHTVEVRLCCADIDSNWIVGSAERRLQITAQGETTETFQCQPLGADRVPSQDYPFRITACEQSGAQVEASGMIEVLPIGFLQFEAQPQKQQIPAKWSWLPNWKSRSAAFQLVFKNNSNLLQSVDLEVRGPDAKRCRHQVEPECIQLPLAEVTPVQLTLMPKRPWIGRSRKLSLDVKPWLSDPRLGSSDPATQTLLLKVMPIIPLWLLLTVLGIVSAVLLRPSPISHLAAVNAVKLSGTSGRSPLVFSASDDCSIRSWNMASQERLQAQGSLPQTIAAETCTTNQPQSSQGILAVTRQAVRSLALVPVKNDQLFAGLENGTIQVWDINQGKPLYTLRDPQDQTSDRILDLLFTRNSRTLYSSYGSGNIRKWERTPGLPFRPQPADVLKLPQSSIYQVWTMALSPDETTLASAGQFKRLVLWDVSKEAASPQQLALSQQTRSRGENDFIWDVDFAPKTRVLAAADSDGYVTLWDMNQCQQTKPVSPPSLPQINCKEQARWQVSKTSVRQIQFTPDQRWMISAGDNGQVQAWPLTSEMTLDPTKKPKIIAALPHRVTSLDVISNSQGVWIATGSEDAQVGLHRFEPGP